MLFINRMKTHRVLGLDTSKLILVSDLAVIFIHTYCFNTQYKYEYEYTN